mgnify:CR=1 FL=1
MVHRSGYVCLTIIISLAVGCAIDPVQSEKQKTQPSAVPNPKKAYLIIGGNVLPEDQPQPTWLAIAGLYYSVHLSTSEAVFEIQPGRRTLKHFDFARSHHASTRTMHLLSTAEFVVRPGTISYYGRVEISRNKRQKIVRTVFDHELYRRACARVPEHFEVLELEVVGPLADHNIELKPCREMPESGELQGSRDP